MTAASWPARSANTHSRWSTPSGGILGYPLDALSEEVAFVAYHFHWPHDEIMALEHADRRSWVTEISAINAG